MTAPTLTCPIDCAVDHQIGDPGFHAEAGQEVFDAYGKPVRVALCHDERGTTGVEVDGREYSLTGALELAEIIRQAVARGLTVQGALR